MEEQMKTLKGFADFNIKDGQLGPFGKFENFLMAENIRENAFSHQQLVLLLQIL